MVRAMIDIANSLGKITVAEGVETMEHCALLAQLGCKVGQGYLWSRPVPDVEFEQLCRNWDAAGCEKLPAKLLAA
jgi:EAL domain-containing protein (putative c-di-GMP-specific phosphodiesterase class I)